MPLAAVEAGKKVEAVKKFLTQVGVQLGVWLLTAAVGANVAMLWRFSERLTRVETKLEMISGNKIAQVK